MLPAFTTQLPGRRQVVTVGYEDTHWNYGEKPTIQPRRFFGDGKGYQFKIDPAPAYSHDRALTEELLELCHERAPLCAPVTVTLLEVLDMRQTNGWAQQQFEHYKCHTPDDCDCDVIDVAEDGTKTKRRTRNWDGIICLNGRTTEIHPAVTRYVTVHEYGHIVEDALGLIRHDEKGGMDAGARLIREWAKVRRIPESSFELSYGVRTHHLMPNEIFANDFRHALGVETEWWPHGEVVPALGQRGTKRAQRWWDDALGELQDCFRQVA